MSSMFLAATGPNEQVYYIIDPEDNNDGVLVTPDRISYIPFWSYTSKVPGLVPVLASDLSRELWDAKAARTKEWAQKFVLHEIPFTEDEIFSVEFLLVPVPDEREPAEER